MQTARGLSIAGRGVVVYAEQSVAETSAADSYAAEYSDSRDANADVIRDINIRAAEDRKQVDAGFARRKLRRRQVNGDVAEDRACVVAVEVASLVRYCD